MGVEFVARQDVGIITLADHATRNALTTETVAAILEILRARSTEVVGFVVASGEKVFSSGADIHWFEQEDLRTSMPVSPIDLFRHLWEAPVPVVAAVEGGAFGGGAELCLACDAIVCSVSGFFSFPELGVGVYPTTAAQLLPEIVGRSRALMWMMTRQRISAGEAAYANLVASVIPDSCAVDVAWTLVRQMAHGAAPSALRALKRVVKHPVDWDAIYRGVDQVETAERQEGAAAFRERRPPRFR